MTYQSPENLIRRIMSGQLDETVSAAANMTPALKVDDSARLTAAAEVLKASGVTSAAVKDNAIAVSAAQMNIAANILDAALQHNMITVKPMLISAEAIDVPVASNPAMSVAKEEAEEVEESRENETEINQGSVDDSGTVKLEPRSLNNRMQNKMKKIDEEEQIDEVSDDTLKSYIKKAGRDASRHDDSAEYLQALSDRSSHDGNLKKPAAAAAQDHRVKSAKRVKGIIKASKKIKEDSDAVVETNVEPLNELSYGKLKTYEKKGSAEVADKASKNRLDSRTARRVAYIAKAKEKSAKKLSKAAFGEEANPLKMITRVLTEGKGRLKATVKSECGKHTAKIYHDSEWGEHRVEFHINGKHHEPADSFHDDYHDAHDTAHHELKRMSKLNGALKEAIEANEDLSWIDEEFEQLDEISKATIMSYKGKAGWSAGQAAHFHDKAIVRAQDHRNNGDENTAARHIDVAKAHAKTYKKREAGLKMANKQLRKEEVAEEGDIPFQQIDELSKDKLKAYGRGALKSQEQTGKKIDRLSATEHGSDEHIKTAAKHDTRRHYMLKAAKKITNGKSDKHKDINHFKNEAGGGPHGNTAYRIKKQKERLGEEIEQLDELQKVGAYTNDAGHKLTIHRHPNDPKHHFVSHEGKVVDYHHGDHKELHKKLTKDGFKGAIHEEEQIDEVSKKTLKSYIDKAQKDKRPAKADPSDPGQFANALHNLKRNAGINAAEKKLKEEVEQVDELSRDTLANYKTKARHDAAHHDRMISKDVAKTHIAHVQDEPELATKFHADAKKHAIKYSNRVHGILKATKKLKSTKGLQKDGIVDKKFHREEVEQVDELSHGTLKSYMSKAEKSRDAHEVAATNYSKMGVNKAVDAHGHKAYKRSLGIGRAGAKRNKEGMEHGHVGPIGSGKTKRMYIDKDGNGHTAKVLAKEEVDLTEAKADREKAKKHLFKHPEADAIGKTMMGATKHFNYVQDAVDHVYNNHSKDLSYEDFDKMRPHFEDHFKKSGLK